MATSLGRQYSARKILTHTRRSEEIDNESYYELSPNYVAYLHSQVPMYKKAFSGPLVRFRIDVSAAYNCHGLTFASRRTCIFSSEEIRKIIEHDGYDRVDLDKVVPGDILLYVADGDVEHSGVVVGIGVGLVPLILSKWGLGPEIIHPANVCPYSYVAPEYYRVSQ